MRLSTTTLNLDAYRAAPRWLIAYSGGVDSHVLLHLLAQLRDQSPSTVPELVAIHINHQLQEQAGEWVKHCQRVCDELAIPLLSETVVIERCGGDSLEALAREARYKVFEQHLQPGECLLLGHHLDDQVETGFQRLFRGSGSLGLGAMADQRSLVGGILLRPLLATSRQAIDDFARAEALHWIEDPSNTDTGFSRNFLRLKLLPEIEQRWPNYRQSVARSLALSREAAELNSELAAIDCQQSGFDPMGQLLSLEVLGRLSTARQRNLLRYWLQQRGLSLPSSAQLQAVLEEVVHAVEDANPVVKWAGVEARRFRGQLYLLPALPPVDSGQVYQWAAGALLELGGNGQLSAEPVRGEGLRPSQGFTIRYRQGGERCRPAGRSGSQSLKKLFQEYSVPTWLRDRVPLIYAGSELAAVAGYWICEPYLARDDEEGINIHWSLS